VAYFFQVFWATMYIAPSLLRRVWTLFSSVDR